MIILFIIVLLTSAVFPSDWSVDYGGMRVYIAKDEQEEVCHNLLMLYKIRSMKEGNLR